MNDTIAFFGFLIGLFAVGFVAGWAACTISFIRKLNIRKDI